MMLSDPRWRFVGRLCLDFAMTGGRGEWAKFERFSTPSDLRDWFAEGPLGLTNVKISESELEAAHDLRDAVQKIAFALLGKQALEPQQVAIVNEFAAAPPLVRTLDSETQKLHITEPASVEELLSELARDTLDLAADPRARDRVRQCQSPDCSLLFFDDSRPGKRRWCSSERCGDRARSRAYRARKGA